MSQSEKAEPENFSGIPQARFVDDVDAFMAEAGNTNIEVVMRNLDEQYSKYRFMLTNVNARKSKLTGQIPDLRKSIEMILELSEQKKKNMDLETEFVISDQAYMKASIPPTDKVYLWLGADVMLEYTLDEAQTFLQSEEARAGKTLKEITKDIDFLRDQLTTMEVNMARVYNWDVRRRQNAAKNSAT